jgi:hypothetical protein
MFYFQNNLHTFLAILIFFCASYPMEHTSQNHNTASSCLTETVIETDAMDAFFEYLDGLDYFEKEIAIIRIKNWLAENEYRPLESIQYNGYGSDLSSIDRYL